MITKTPLDPARVRKIVGSFAFIEHRFLRRGFFSVLTHHELLLFCTLLRVTLDDYIIARDSLIEKDLIAFNGHLFQVLSLPEQVPKDLAPLKGRDDMQAHDPATIHQIISRSIGANHD
jgi:hypothetical protein